MILTTRRADSPRSKDEALLLDIDLSILGREPQVFQRLPGDLIRREYAWVPDHAFARARARCCRDRIRLREQHAH